MSIAIGEGTETQNILLTRFSSSVATLKIEDVTWLNAVNGHFYNCLHNQLLINHSWAENNFIFDLYLNVESSLSPEKMFLVKNRLYQKFPLYFNISVYFTVWSVDVVTCLFLDNYLHGFAEKIRFFFLQRKKWTAHIIRHAFGSGVCFCAICEIS